MKKATAHVLVVDDNEAFAEALRRTLVKLGFAASTATAPRKPGSCWPLGARM